jgi:hypothetical protein
MRFVRYALLALAAPLFGGGFYLEVGAPRDAKTVMVARLTGCHHPEEGKLQGTAEGLLNGKRQSLPLRITALSEPGAYAITQQWPVEGKWVVHLTATHPTFDRPTESVIPVSGKTFTREGAIFTGAQRVVTPAQVDAMLQSK